VKSCGCGLLLPPLMMLPRPEIDIGALQEALEERARQGGAEPPMYQLRLQQLAPTLDLTVRVDPTPPLIGTTRYERLWVIINRFVRRVARHGVEPAVLAQNEANTAMLKMLGLLVRADATLHAEIVRLRADEQHDAA
jgi:hypothetical protein